MIEAAFNRFHYANEMTELFNDGLKGNLYEDLLMVSRTYHKIMNRNKKLISISLKGSPSLPNAVHQEASRSPQQLKNLLSNYLISMSEQGKVITSNPQMQAMSFMWMNYGAFISRLHENESISESSLDEFIEESVCIFTKALTP